MSRLAELMGAKYDHAFYYETIEIVQDPQWLNCRNEPNDWRTHVDGEIRNIWESLQVHSKVMAFIMAWQMSQAATTESPKSGDSGAFDAIQRPD